jgi:hypothetical protein
MLSCSNKALCRHAISLPRAWTRVDEMAALVHVQQAVIAQRHGATRIRTFENPTFCPFIVFVSWIL